MKIISNKYTDWFLSKVKVSAITLYPFIIVKTKLQKNKKLLNHEKIHLAQQKELFVIGFYVWYICSFVKNYLKFFDYWASYQYIIFEREAYINEKNFSYLKNRKKFNFLKF
jgi:hypothetical protein